MLDLAALPFGTWTSLAGIGPGSSVVEVVAASVGAGILLGGFFAGTAALLRPGRDANHLAMAGYLGGWLAAALLLSASRQKSFPA